MELRKAVLPGAEFDARGMESIAYDIQKYLERMGSSVALKTFAEFAEVTQKEDAFGPDGTLNYMSHVPAFVESAKSPSTPTDMTSFIELRETYLDIFNTVFNEHGLDAVIYPQMQGPLGPLHGDETIDGMVVSEVNIAGLPAVTIPAGFYASGAPFNLVIVARQWTEAEMLAIAYAYEQGTKHRKAPELEKA
ncbi:amidase family protein [Psychrobacter glaciei]